MRTTGTGSIFPRDGSKTRVGCCWLHLDAAEREQHASSPGMTGPTPRAKDGGCWEEEREHWDEPTPIVHNRAEPRWINALVEGSAKA